MATSENHVNIRVLGSVDVDTPKLRARNKKRIKLAAAGAYPFAIRELMRLNGRRIFGNATDDLDREQGKLLICYSWWARALENGIPKKHIEEYMLDHLDDLDGGPSPNGAMKKWETYGG